MYQLNSKMEMYNFNNIDQPTFPRYWLDFFLNFYEQISLQTDLVS